MHTAILLAVLTATLGLFIWGRIRYDAVTLLALLALVVTGIVVQSDTLAMGPGSYRFRDYWPPGAPMEFIVVAVSAVAIPLAWPLSPP